MDRKMGFVYMICVFALLAFLFYICDVEDIDE